MYVWTEKSLILNLYRSKCLIFALQLERVLQGLKTERSLAAERQDRIQLSVDLKQSFNDFKIEENYKADKSNYLRLPQLPVKAFDCVSNQETLIQPPEMELENHSKYRDKYYSILNNQAKPFSKKMGLFTMFANRTRPEKEMNKIYDLLKA